MSKRVDAEEQHDRAQDQYRREAESALSTNWDPDTTATAWKRETGTLPTPILDVAAFPVLIVVTHYDSSSKICPFCWGRVGGSAWHISACQRVQNKTVCV
jgi:hypothetical protein